MPEIVAGNVALVTKSLVHNGGAAIQEPGRLTFPGFMDFSSLCEASTILDGLHAIESSDSLFHFPLTQALTDAGCLGEFRPAIDRARLRRLALRVPDQLGRRLPTGRWMPGDGGDDLRDSQVLGEAGQLLGIDYGESLDRLAEQLDEMIKFPSLYAEGADPTTRALRSNGYLITAFANGLDYFPDFDRAPFVAATVKDLYKSLPRQLYEGVANSLNLSEPRVKDVLIHEWTLNTVLPIPPATSLVMHRARSLDEIPIRLLEVRDDFSRFREYFRAFRVELQEADSIRERKKLQSKYTQLLAMASGEDHEIITVAEALGLVEKLAKVGINPASPTSYSTSLLTQPAEWIRRWWLRRPLTVLFRLDSKLPKLSEYGRLIQRLWGESIADSVLDQYAVHAASISRLLTPSPSLSA